MSKTQEYTIEQLSLLLDMVVRVEEVPTQGRKYDFAADEQTLKVLAEHSAATELTQFEGFVEIRPIRGGLEAKGKLKAALQQPCVVTLEPVEEQIDVAIERIYLRGEEPELDLTANGEVFVDLEVDADTEWFTADKIDLSDFIYEQYLLNIDPYPKKQGAELSNVKDDEDSGELSPFAALAALKQTK
ncbi:YceD family protein [Maritalea porphyrae]|uniref:YceD family protein n=1 Tax=Maritalea porphyrae TaxID=880732 RepID=UPI0022AE9559|nr:DUF177 domain-containing protein [Maritalea porphyrae]MCZ4270824.1 DUF177 domain-containing protein [Maritalea porphyrae]